MKKLITAVVLAGIVLTSTASATPIGTVNIQHHNNSISDTGRLWGGGLNGGTYYTGVYSWKNEGGTNAGTGVPDWGFCIELTQGPYNGLQDVVNLEDAPMPALYGTPTGTLKANYIRELWGRNFSQNWITNPTSANRKMAEAFGACLWEIIYETDTWNVKTGAGFHCSSVEQADLANTWLSELNGNTAYIAKAANLAATSAPDGQDYLVQLPVSPIPEPATICLLGLGALSLIRRKK
jgi:hypothetical protein